MSRAPATRPSSPAVRRGPGGVAAVLSGLALAAGATLGAESVDWALHERSCGDEVVAEDTIACGELGVLHFGIEEESGCPRLAGGEEVPPLYPAPTTDLAAPPAEWEDGDGGPPTDPDAPWIALVDWRGWHGASVRTLARQMAVGAVSSRFYALDDPALPFLGDTIGDGHVLAQLCRVAEDRAARDEPLLAVNMSFGRRRADGDPEGADCEPDSLACQIARVLAHLRGEGATPIAAGGNHARFLFPAVLDDAIATGALDLVDYVRPQWESPIGVDALLPGNALCVAGRAAPAGSSYATALFTGWYAMAAVADPGIDPFAGSWRPSWSQELECPRLMQDGTPRGPCNPALEEVLAGILYGGEASGCWSEPGTGGRPLLTTSLLPAELPPPVPSLDHWVARQHRPAPESDPCIPCVGYDFAAKGPADPPRPAEILIALSATAGMDETVHVDRVLFRTGGTFRPLGLDPLDLLLLARGALGGISLGGLEDLPQILHQPSLIYVLKTDPAADCDDPANTACYWTSTPLLLR